MGGHVQGPTLGLTVPVQDVDQAGETAHRGPFKVADDAGVPPVAAFPQDLTAAGDGVTAAVPVTGLQQHHPAPQLGGQTDSQQLGTGPDAVGHVGGGGLGMGEVGGRMRRQKHLGHGRFPLVSEVVL